MKEELTTKMHAEFPVSDDIDIKHKVGSAIQYAMISDKKEEDLNEVLSLYGITSNDYDKWKGHWAKIGVKIGSTHIS